MTHVIAVKTELTEERLLERENHSQPIHRGGKPACPPRPPGPQLRGDVVQDLRPARMRRFGNPNVKARIVGLIVLLEMLSRTIRRPMDLVQMFDAQPLATIPYIRTAFEIRRARLKRALAVLLAAGATAVVLLAIHHYYMPLGMVLDRLRST